jgi:hypothetical protein
MNSKIKEFEIWIEKYPFLKGGNSLQRTSESYGIIHEPEYSSSWVQGVFEMWQKEVDSAKEYIEVLKFERVPLELFNEVEDKMKEFKTKHHEFADACNTWEERYRNEIQKHNNLLKQAELWIISIEYQDNEMIKWREEVGELNK